MHKYICMVFIYAGVFYKSTYVNMHTYTYVYIFNLFQFVHI